eukprot:SAG11_NODE_38752_length_251_cov_0.500000_1_plen_75_part_10
MNRWHAMSACLFAISAGTVGSWGVYSETIKIRFSLSQRQLDTIASANAYINIALLSVRAAPASIQTLVGDKYDFA